MGFSCLPSSGRICYKEERLILQSRVVFAWLLDLLSSWQQKPLDNGGQKAKPSVAVSVNSLFRVFVATAFVYTIPVLFQHHGPCSLYRLSGDRITSFSQSFQPTAAKERDKAAHWGSSSPHTSWVGLLEMQSLGCIWGIESYYHIMVWASLGNISCPRRICTYGKGDTWLAGLMHMVVFPSGGWDQWPWKSLAELSPKSSLVYMVQTHVTSVVTVHMRWFSLHGCIS